MRLARWILVAALAGAPAVAAGCGTSTRTDEDSRIADLLVGRWTGRAIDPPARAWFEDGLWDVFFSPAGQFSAEVSTGPNNRYKVFLAGEYRLSYGTLYIDQSSLAGKWKIVEKGHDRIEMTSSDMQLVLQRRIGT